MNISTLEKFLHAPFGAVPEDKYINNRYIEHLKKGKRIGFFDKFGLGDLRFLTVKKMVRSLLGSSVAVQRNTDHTGQLFLASEQQAMRNPEYVMPKKGWRASSSDERKYRGIYKPRGKFQRPANTGWKRFKINTCPFAGGCKAYCLRATGNIQLLSSARSRYLKTWFFFTQPLAFLRLLVREIISHAASANRQRKGYYLRLNGMSDIEWERFLYMDNFVKDTAGLRGFYDYTKHPKKNRIDMAKRIPGGVPFPEKYKLIFSWDEKKQTPKRAGEWIRSGRSISVVYPYSLHSEIKRLKRQHKFIKIGDEDDNRFKDKAKSIIFLKNKGDLKEKKRNADNQTTLITPIHLITKLVKTMKGLKR
jgi:hypothetical protein